MSVIYHYGIKGMHWGNRKNNVTFISGTSKMEDQESKYYRREIPKAIAKRIDHVIKTKGQVLIGDCVGFDKMAQEYIAKKGYGNVHIYVSGSEVRNNADKDGSLGWRVKNVDASMHEKNSTEWHAMKDIAMNKIATSGISVILDNGAAATRKNIDRLLADNKKVSIYELNGDDPKKDTMQSTRKYIKNNRKSW